MTAPLYIGKETGPTRARRFSTQHKLGGFVGQFLFNITPAMFEGQSDEHHAYLVITSVECNQRHMGYIGTTTGGKGQVRTHPLHFQGGAPANWTLDVTRLLAIFGDNTVSSTPWLVNTSKDLELQFTTFIPTMLTTTITIHWECFDHGRNPLAVREILGTRDDGAYTIGFAEMQ